MTVVLTNQYQFGVSKTDRVHVTPLAVKISGTRAVIGVLLSKVYFGNALQKRRDDGAVARRA